jgi:hypothetical protein
MVAHLESFYGPLFRRHPVTPYAGPIGTPALNVD